MSIGLEFQINMYAVSGLKVDSLRLFHEGYKPYKVNYQWGVCAYVSVCVCVYVCLRACECQAVFY